MTQEQSKWTQEKNDLIDPRLFITSYVYEPHLHLNF